MVYILPDDCWLLPKQVQGIKKLYLCLLHVQMLVCLKKKYNLIAQNE